MVSLDSGTVQRVQRYLGIQADGIFGPVTLSATERALGIASAQLLKSAPAPAGNISERIIATALHFVNLVETKSNAEWDDPSTPGVDSRARELRAALIAAGFSQGQPYCMAFAEGVWRIAYAEASAPVAIQARIKSLLCPHVMTSFRACRTAGLISTTPIAGAIGFMQKGASDSGHAFIVRAVADGYLRTIEGNTSPAPGSAAADREGDGVFEKQRRFSLSRTSGLWIRGFLNPL